MREFVDAAIKPVMPQHSLPGMAVAVTVDGQAFSEAGRWLAQLVDPKP
ncbi:MAG: hypothetical protein ABIX12_13765 [Rubrivivax sp.]